MRPHRLTFHFLFLCLIISWSNTASAKRRKAPPGGKVAVVVDERLSALRKTPDLRGTLIRRLGRGRLVAIRSVKTGREGIGFYLVNVTSRTQGWIQREAVVSAGRNGDDGRLLELIERSADFDRIVGAQLFLDHFPRSALKAKVLFLLGESAEQASEKLTSEASKRPMDTTTAPLVSYFLNYRGLDRYNRQGVTFVFDERSKHLHYDGAAWRELIRRYPKSPQAVLAQEKLEKFKVRPGPGKN